MLRSWTIIEGPEHVTCSYSSGTHLAEQIEEFGMSAGELGQQLKVPINRITGILNGWRAMTGDCALNEVPAISTR